MKMVHSPVEKPESREDLTLDQERLAPVKDLKENLKYDRTPEEQAEIVRKIQIIAQVLGENPHVRVIPGRGYCVMPDMAAQQIAQKYILGEIDSIDDVPDDVFEFKYMVYDEEELKHASERKILGTIDHENGHLLDTDTKLAIEGQRKAFLDGNLPTSIMNLWNALEDPWVNNRQMARSPETAERLLEVYSDKEQDEQIRENISKCSLLRQLGLSINFYWSQGAPLENVDPRVAKVFDQIEPYVNDYFYGESSESNAKVLYEKIWPVARTLEKEQLKDYIYSQLQNQGKKSGKNGSQGSSSGQGGGNSQSGGQQQQGSQPSEGAQGGGGGQGDPMPQGPTDPMPGGGGGGSQQPNMPELPNSNPNDSGAGEGKQSGNSGDRDKKHNKNNGSSGSNEKGTQEGEKPDGKDPAKGGKGEDGTKRDSKPKPGAGGGSSGENMSPEEREELERQFNSLSEAEKAELMRQAKEALDKQQAGELAKDPPPGMKVNEGKDGQPSTCGLQDQPDKKQIKQGEQNHKKADKAAKEKSKSKDKPKSDQSEGESNTTGDSKSFKKDRERSGFSKKETELYRQYRQLEIQSRAVTRKLIQKLTPLLPRLNQGVPEGESYFGSTLNRKSLARRVPVGDGRIYQGKGVEPGKQARFYLGLSIDRSISMISPLEKLLASRKTCISLAQVASHFDMPVSINSFAEDVTKILGFEQDFNDKSSRAKPKMMYDLANLGYGTNIGDPLLELEVDLIKARRLFPNSGGLILVVSDGGANTGPLGQELNDIIFRLRKHFAVVNILLSPSGSDVMMSENNFGKDNVVIARDFNELPNKAAQIFAKVFKKYVDKLNKE